MLVICFLLMTIYSSSVFIIQYQIYIKGVCKQSEIFDKDKKEHCKVLDPFANVALIAMSAVFVIDQICSIVLLISVNRIYKTIEQYFPDEKPNKCAFGLHIFAFIVPNLIQFVIMILAINSVASTHGRRIALAMSNGFSTDYFFVL